MTDSPYETGLDKNAANYTPLIFNYFIQTAFSLDERFYLKPRNASCVHLQPINCVTGAPL